MYPARHQCFAPIPRTTGILPVIGHIIQETENSMPNKFKGFSKKMPAFFRSLEKNNTREWFTPRKELFESEVRAPMIELVTLINEDLKRFALHNSVATPAKAIYRLYRDTRFSKDKTPYKAHIGATFGRQSLAKHSGAGFYFGVSDKEVEVAGGMYMPEAEQLAAVRQAMISDSTRFLKLVKAPALILKMGPLVGTKLKRCPKGFENAGDDLLEYVKHTQMYFYVTLDPKLALLPRLRGEVVRRFQLMADLLEWMNQAILAAGKDRRGTRSSRSPRADVVTSTPDPSSLGTAGASTITGFG